MLKAQTESTSGERGQKYKKPEGGMPSGFVWVGMCGG